jgi:two-component system sensor histidine kinase KdpD
MVANIRGRDVPAGERANGAPAASGEYTLEMLSSIAHELRTPLAALAASAEILPTAEEEERERLANIIGRQARRLSGIVDGLLDAYRYSNGNAIETREHANLTELLDDLAAEHAVLYPRHRFVVESDGQTAAAVDRRVLGMIISNLLTNAARYAPEDSTIEITCRQQGGGAEIRVADEGPGVPTHLHRRPYRAGVRGESRPGPGCGLGLFIAERLCAAMGAELKLERRTGRGACFVVVVHE